MTSRMCTMSRNDARTEFVELVASIRCVKTSSVFLMNHCSYNSDLCLSVVKVLFHHTINPRCQVSATCKTAIH